MSVKTVDLNLVIKEKSPKLYRYLPGFVISYLKKILHQDLLNGILVNGEGLDPYEFIEYSLKVLKTKYSVAGINNVPLEGRFIFAGNHPLGGLDGIIFALEVGKIYPDLKFPVNDLLLNVPNLRKIFLPLNKHGKQGRDAARLLEEAYASDSQILYFPAGLCSRKQKGKIQDLDWKKNFVSKAVKYKRDIIPVHFKGANSSFFYNLANLRAHSGIKFNIEMIYLPDEMTKQEGKEISLTFGKPVTYQTIIDSGLSMQEWSDKLHKMVHEM
ncbi:MAG: 1-acyl-sn-glycerol-3-phosphate acyltransferase [Bacteroidales bacterium]|nr:1-acyl-sn-glycerol-3-phosphate acyltransferase [Bacteroidales bacterium]